MESTSNEADWMDFGVRVVPESAGTARIESTVAGGVVDIDPDALPSKELASIRDAVGARWDQLTEQARSAELVFDNSQLDRAWGEFHQALLDETALVRDAVGELRQRVNLAGQEYQGTDWHGARVVRGALGNRAV